MQDGVSGRSGFNWEAILHYGGLALLSWSATTHTVHCESKRWMDANTWKWKGVRWGEVGWGVQYRKLRFMDIKSPISSLVTHCLVCLHTDLAAARTPLHILQWHTHLSTTSTAPPFSFSIIPCVTWYLGTEQQPCRKIRMKTSHRPLTHRRCAWHIVTTEQMIPLMWLSFVMWNLVHTGGYFPDKIRNCGWLCWRWEGKLKLHQVVIVTFSWKVKAWVTFQSS